MKTPVDLKKSQRVRLTPEAIAQGVYPSAAVCFQRKYHIRGRVTNPVGTTLPFKRLAYVNHMLVRVQWDHIATAQHIRPEHLEVIE